MNQYYRYSQKSTRFTIIEKDKINNNSLMPHKIGRTKLFIAFDEILQ